MGWDKIQKSIPIILPIIGIGLMVYYEVCNTSCSHLQGTLVGIDLKYVGILFMVVLLALLLMPVRYKQQIGHLRTMMLSGAMGGEILLVRFQIVHDVYCPFCLAFGLCVFVLFCLQFPRMNKWLALGAFCLGIAAFAFLFQGSTVPQYG